MQEENITFQKCDLCEERSTSYSSGHGRWCDKHSPLPNMDWSRFQKQKQKGAEYKDDKVTLHLVNELLKTIDKHLQERPKCRHTIHKILEDVKPIFSE